ncbi:diguanylate cyclase [Luteimonas aestuarii]|uniref:diguanylate cyclase n=1 Tax=Luteimonas aestuarii TaxID=453837 RepID=A0A4R5U444_9GAMM|nr:diguanylate cyclase [Luteimonas aestuarii]TDK28394.1 diguanylate cyclase [Luteimonas aestuarii]
MHRFRSIVLLVMALSAAPASADDALESAIAEVERLAVTAHWRESNAGIEALHPRRGAMSDHQRHRIDYVASRNRALAGDHLGALEDLGRLLQQAVEPDLHVRAYTTAISVAANVEDWPLAFRWLGQALERMPEASAPAASRVHGVASYLLVLAGESNIARFHATRALAMAEAEGAIRETCLALSEMGLVEDHAGNYREAERWRRRQIDACGKAGDPVFTAIGHYGVGKMLNRQGRHAEALVQTRRALEVHGKSGYLSGTWGARMVVAESLIASGGDLDEAGHLLAGALDYYREEGIHFAIAEAEEHMARLAEARDDLPEAVRYYQLAMASQAAAERDVRERRVAYLQLEFDTRVKEQQIALLEAEAEVAALQASATRRRQWLLAAGMGGLLATALLLTGLLRRSFLERKRYRWQSEHDSLTGLYNYQQLRKLGEQAFQQARTRAAAFTAIVADIDRFKDVNDRHGHAAGDEALRSLGGWITGVVGDAGIAGRSGGDEFSILLEADAAAAEVLLQRLRDRVEPITVFGQTVHFSISAGTCQSNGDIDSLEELIHEADQALYRAKQQGRDRVVHASGEPRAASRGASLVVVGSGIDFGRHASERCLSEIREAEVVFCLVDPFALAMIRGIHPDAIDLGVHYATGKDRRETYRGMDAAIMQALHAGHRVCAVFYGHPGVFADVPHAVVRKAREAGIPARMEPGVSSEACLYADLGIDPGRWGVQSMEATQFLVHDRRPDPAGLLLLWQVALSGDLACTRFHAEREGLQSLVDKLLHCYPPDHQVILYEAARLPIETFRAERVALRDLPEARYQEYTTLVVPPLHREGGVAEDAARAAFA